MRWSTMVDAQAQAIDGRNVWTRVKLDQAFDALDDQAGR